METEQVKYKYMTEQAIKNEFQQLLDNSLEAVVNGNISLLDRIGTVAKGYRRKIGEGIDQETYKKQNDLSVVLIGQLKRFQESVGKKIGGWQSEQSQAVANIYNDVDEYYYAWAGNKLDKD